MTDTDVNPVEENMGLSLSALAEFDTTGLSAMTSRLPPKGIFLVRDKSVMLTEKPSQDPDKPNLYMVTFKYECLEATLADPEVDAEAMVGREFTETYTLWPDQMQELIQLLMGRYKKVGLEHHGRLGGVAEMEPGWLDGVVDHVFNLRIRHWTTKSGNEQAGYDWAPAETGEE